MSKLNELIAQLCPNGVEFRELGDVCTINKGRSLSKADKGLGDTPIILYGELYTTYGNYITNVVSSTSDERAKTATVATRNSLLLPISSTSKEAQIGKASALCVDCPVYIGGDAIILEHKQNAGFLVHLLNSRWFEEKKMKCVHGTTIMHLSPRELAKIKIPVPPLPVQREIARILDIFTESSVKLFADIEKERALRKKQCLEYSHTLFVQSDCVKRTTLGEIVDICMCKRIMKAQTDTVGDVPFYQNGTLGGEAKLFISYDLFQEYAQKYKFPRKGDVMLSTVGTVGKTIQYDGEPAYFQDSNIVWLKRKTEDVTNEYLYWFCISMPWKLPERATLKHLHNYMIAETEISIPSKERQEYVIAKFQELESAFKLIDKELTSEIESRQKQYEYYRDRLLMFEVK